MTYKYLSICDLKTVKKAYSVYLSAYIDWGNSVPMNFDEFKEDYTKSNSYDPSFAFFKDKNFVGYGLIMSNNPLHLRLDIGYAVEKKQRGKGYGTEICKLLIEIAKEKYKPNLILADTFDNPKSERVLLKNGFKKGGEVPQFNLATGKPRSVKFFYLLINA